MSEVFWETLEKFDGTINVLICTFWNDLVTNRAVTYAQCVSEHGAPLPSCIGFLDCTEVFMNRPGGASVNQRACYSGHKRTKCLNYLTITTPDGLVIYMYGPEEGRRHDVTLYRKSGLDNFMQQFLLIHGTKYYVYGRSGLCHETMVAIRFPPIFCKSNRATI